MKQMLFFLLLGLFLIIGCTMNNLVSDYDVTNIPGGANYVKLESDIQADSLYNIIINTLYFEGYGVQHSDSKILSITTDDKHLGESVHLKMRIIIQKNGSKSTVLINGDCRKGQVSSVIFGVESQGSQWLEAKWGSPMFINRTGFAGIINFANKIPHTKIEYFIR